MLKTLDQWVDDHPSLRGLAPQESWRTILVTDEAGEVESMCSRGWVCRACGRTGDDDPSLGFEFCDEDTIVPVTARIFAWDGSPVDWEAVLYETDHIQEAGTSVAEYMRPGLPKPRPLTAVVLVGEAGYRNAKFGDGFPPDAWGCNCDRRSLVVPHPDGEAPKHHSCRWTKLTSLDRDARTACASAGVQFLTAGEELRL